MLIPIVAVSFVNTCFSLSIQTLCERVQTLDRKMSILYCGTTVERLNNKLRGQTTTCFMVSNEILYIALTPGVFRKFNLCQD